MIFKKRVDNVKAVAHMMSERARYFKSNIEVDPMSAFERRVVHEFLSNATDLKPNLLVLVLLASGYKIYWGNLEEPLPTFGTPLLIKERGWG